MARPHRADGRGLLAALGLLPLLAGCPSLVLTSSARTLAPREVEQAASIGAQRVRIVDARDPLDKGESLWSPVFEYAVRFGLTERLDLEGRASLPWGGLSLSPRLQLLRGPQDGPGLDLMLAGTLGAAGTQPASGDGAWAPFFAIAAPIGLALGGGHQLVLAPRATWIFTGLGDAALLGGSLALVLRVHGDARRGWYLIPECATAGVAADPRLDVRGPIVQCALGLATRQAR